MLLEYVGERRVAKRIEDAVYGVQEEGRHLAGDLGGTASTEEITLAIIDKL